jgi:hypothetical protein
LGIGVSSVGKYRGATSHTKYQHAKTLARSLAKHSACFINHLLSIVYAINWRRERDSNPR